MLLSYYYETGNSFSEDRPKTPTLNDPMGKQRLFEVERLRLLASRQDGLSGIQDYLSHTSHSQNLQFVLLFLNSFKTEKKLNMYFISWDKYLDNKDQYGLDFLSESLDSCFNIIDLDTFFPKVILTCKLLRFQ